MGPREKRAAPGGARPEVGSGRKNRVGREEGERPEVSMGGDCPRIAAGMGRVRDGSGVLRRPARGAVQAACVREVWSG